MAGDALTHDQFVAYAHEQIRTIEHLLAGHCPTDAGSCACDRDLPCSQARSMAAMHVHYRHQLALVGRTQLLPVVPPPAASAAPGMRHRRRRGVFVALIRLWRRSPRRGDV